MAIKVKSVVSGVESRPDVWGHETKITFPTCGQDYRIEMQFIPIAKLQAIFCEFFYARAVQVNVPGPGEPKKLGPGSLGRFSK